MGLPTSTIVMGAATCASFAIAIASGSKPTEPVDTGPLDDHALVAKLVGPSRASLGPLFEDVSFDVDTDADTRARLAAFTPARIELDYAHNAVSTIHVHVDHSCTLLAQDLVARWSDGVVVGDAEVWVDPVRRQRVAIGGYFDCDLTIDRYVSASVLVNPSHDSLVPLWTLGHFASELDSIAQRVADGNLTWTVPGVGAGVGKTTLVAKIDRGEIATLVATGETDAATMVELRESVEAILGTPTSEPPNTSRWWSTPAATLEEHGHKFVLTIGAL